MHVRMCYPVFAQMKLPLAAAFGTDIESPCSALSEGVNSIDSGAFMQKSCVFRPSLEGRRITKSQRGRAANVCI